MPILSAQGESDARVAAWLLAQTAADCLTGGIPQVPETALNNVYLLLEAAKVNPFFGFERGDSNTGRAIDEPVFLSPARETHVRDVKTAVDRALRITFSNKSAESAIDDLENVLRGLAYPDRFEPPTLESRALAKQFFEALVHQLKVS